MFLTGQDEIESLAKLITDCAQHCGSGEFNLLLKENRLAAQVYKHYFSGEENQKLVNTSVFAAKVTIYQLEF